MHVHEFGRGRGTSGLPTERGAQHRAPSQNLWDHDLNGGWTLDWLTHPGVLFLFLKCCYNLIDSNMFDVFQDIELVYIL